MAINTDLIISTFKNDGVIDTNDDKAFEAALPDLTPDQKQTLGTRLAAQVRERQLVQLKVAMQDGMITDKDDLSLFTLEDKKTLLKSVGVKPMAHLFFFRGWAGPTDPYGSYNYDRLLRDPSSELKAEFFDVFSRSWGNASLGVLNSALSILSSMDSSRAFEIFSNCLSDPQASTQSKQTLVLALTREEALFKDFTGRFFAPGFPSEKRQAFEAAFSPQMRAPVEANLRVVLHRLKEQGIRPSQITFHHFWAIYCDPCLDEMAQILALARDLKKEGVRIHFHAYDYGKDAPRYKGGLAKINRETRAYWREKGAGFYSPIYSDNTRSAVEQLSLKSTFPATMLTVNGKGKSTIVFNSVDKPYDGKLEDAEYVFLREGIRSLKP